MHKIVVVNGRPRSGKDSTVEYLMQHLFDKGVYFSAVSSVDPIRFMLQREGIDTDNKTPALRNLMAKMKSALDDFNDHSTHKCIEFCLHKFGMHLQEPTIVFLHIREPHNIDKLKAEVMKVNRNIAVTAILVRSPRGEIVDNPADQGVEDYNYDYIVVNDGSLEHLQETCSHLAAALMIKC